MGALRPGQWADSGRAVPVVYQLGSRRFLLAVALCQGAGSVLALLVARAAAVSPNSWGSELYRHTCVDPTIWIVGALAAATASMSTLWRRRIRTIVLVFLATAALFAGHLQDPTRLMAAVVGVLLGPLLVGRAVRSPSLGGTIRERRTLIALVVAASVLGPVFAAVSAQAIGPLSVLRELFDDVPFSSQELRDVCADPALREQCREGDQALRLFGLGPAAMNLMPSVMLLAGAEGLRRGRYAGWLVSACGYLLLTIVAAVSLTLRINEQDHTPLSIIDQIVSISEEWVADKGLPEMGFTLGGVTELRDPGVRVLLAVDRDDHVHAVTGWMPVYRDGVMVGLTLDFMRGRARGVRTAMGFLITSAVKAAHEQGSRCSACPGLL